MGWCEDRHIEYSLGGWLREKRQSLGLGQKDIGAAVGVHVVTVHFWETGGSWPGTLARLKAWTRAVNCKLEITVVEPNGERHSF